MLITLLFKHKTLRSIGEPRNDMRKYFFWLLFIVLWAMSSSVDMQLRAQAPVYSFDNASAKSQGAKTEIEIIGKAQKTADVAVFKGKNYPVYAGSRGGRFIVVATKSGSYSKKYLPKG